MIIENIRSALRTYGVAVFAAATISTGWSATPTDELTQADQIRRLTERVEQLEQLLGEVQSNPALTSASEGESAYPESAAERIRRFQLSRQSVLRKDYESFRAG